MAQTRRKRRRKHRGTQSGRIDSRPKGRPRNRAEAKQRAKARRSGSKGKRGAQGMPLRPPSWRSAAFKAIPIAGLFFLLIVVAFGEAPGPSLGLAAFMLLFYIPMAYYTDRFFYNRQLRKQARAREERAQGGAGS